MVNKTNNEIFKKLESQNTFLADEFFKIDENIKSQNTFLSQEILESITDLITVFNEEISNLKTKLTNMEITLSQPIEGKPKKKPIEVVNNKVNKPKLSKPKAVNPKKSNGNSSKGKVLWLTETEKAVALCFECDETITIDDVEYQGSWFPKSAILTAFESVDIEQDFIIANWMLKKKNITL